MIQYVAAGAKILLQEQWCGGRKQDLVAEYSELSFKVVFLAFDAIKNIPQIHGLSEKKYDSAKWSEFAFSNSV